MTSSIYIRVQLSRANDDGLGVCVCGGGSEETKGSFPTCKKQFSRPWLPLKTFRESRAVCGCRPIENDFRLVLMRLANAFRAVGVKRLRTR